MGDLRVNVTASKTKSVTVKANSVQTPISATPDLSLYYSDVAKDWAGKAENSANSAAGSAESAANSASSILNNEDVRAVIENLPAIAAAPENAQIAQEQAEIATSQAVISTEQATLATTQANIAKESADSAAENASIILEQTDAAQQAAVNANTSAVNADTSANSAREYMDNAEASAIAAKASETNAKTSASEALTSKNSASSSATSASTSATTATNKASEASTSATQAANSATSAQGYAQEARGYRDEAQEIADSMSGALNAYSKEETDALLAKKQDVLGATDPISIGSTTMGGPVNVNITDNKLLPLYTNLPNGNTTGSTTKIFVNDTISTPINDIETLFSGDCSYFDVPVNFAEHIASGQATEIKLELGGMDTLVKGYGMSFLLGEQTETGFEPIIFGNTQYNSTVGSGIGQTWILGSIAQSTTNGRLTVNAITNNTRPTTQNTDKYNGHRFRFIIDGSNFTMWTGTGNNTTEYYTRLAVSKTSEYTAKFSKINVIRCWWCPSNTLVNYMPSVDNTILSYGGVDSGWRITDGAVTTYGVSLKYDPNTLKVNDNGELESIGGVSIDNTTITENALGEIQAVAVVDSNTSNAIKTWTGTRAEYDAIVTKDATTLYNITDDTDVTLSLLELLYPIGAIYIGTMATCPLQILGVGNWQLVASDRVLQGAGIIGNVRNLVEAGLPNIEGKFRTLGVQSTQGGDITQSGSITFKQNLNKMSTSSGTNYWNEGILSIDASLSSDVYGNSTTVQPSAYLVNIWERIS